MAIAFDNIPSGMLVPFAYFEAHPAPAPFNDALKCILIGHKRENGTAVADTPYILSQSNVEQLFGRGGMVEAMYRKAKQNYPFAEFWGIATAQDEGSVRSTATITVAQEPTRNGNMHLRIAGYPVQIAIRNADTKAQIATRLTAQINKQGQLPCTAEVDGSDTTVINLTCKWKGTSGNNIVINRKRWGEDEETLAQKLLTNTSFTAGAGNANLSGALAALGDQHFDVFAVGFKGTTGQMDALQDFLDGVSGRWSPSKQLYGHAVNTNIGAFADLVSLGLTRNDPHMTLLGVEGSPTPPWEWTAALAAVMTGHLASPPEVSRPLQAIELKGVEPSPTMADWFDHSERQSLLDAGVSVFRVTEGRRVFIDRVVTTYQTNVWGDSDSSWRDVETMFQNQFFIRYLRQQITSRFPRSALTDEPKNIPGFVSPGQIKDLIIHVYIDLENQGLVENSDLFAQVLVVERDELEANRVNALIPIDVVNQFRIFAARVESNLQLRDAPRLEV